MTTAWASCLFLLVLICPGLSWSDGFDLHFQGSTVAHRTSFIYSLPDSSFSLEYAYSADSSGVLLVCPLKHFEKMLNHTSPCSVNLWKDWECGCYQDAKLVDGGTSSYNCTWSPGVPEKFGLYSLSCLNNTAAFSAHWTLKDGPNMLDKPRFWTPVVFTVAFVLGLVEIFLGSWLMVPEDDESRGSCILTTLLIGNRVVSINLLRFSERSLCNDWFYGLRLVFIIG